MNKPNIDATYGTVYIITDNDCGYDWDRKDEKYQVYWEPEECMMEKLKKCPFCGGEVKINEHYGLYGNQVVVYCRECNSIFKSCKDSSGKNVAEENAIKAWNTRVEEE